MRAGDSVLVDRFRNGDASAFEEIVRRHQKDVYCVARRFLREHAEADEAAQQAFVRAWRGLSGFRSDASLKTWLTRIVINVCKTRLGRGSRELALESISDEIPSERRTDEPLQRAEAQRAVRRAVERLAPRQRQVVLLKIFSGRTHREVAETLDLTEGAVKAHLHQAIANLRRFLREPLGALDEL